MMTKVCIVIFIVKLWAITAQVPANNGDYNYDNPNADWGNVNPTCNLSRQSPIALKTYTSAIVPIRPLVFTNYDIPLSEPLVLRNDGHSASLNIPVTLNGSPPYISGGQLNGRYEAINIHFHWGSSTTKGSEHTVDGMRYDVEMHIVHKNVKYATFNDAINYKDGVAVLGIFLKQTQNPVALYPGLEKIYQQLPNIIQYNTNATLQGTFTMNQVLGDIDVDHFFAYQGSLTTPPCAESVSWIVFPSPLAIGQPQNFLFFNLLDRRGQPLINNFRPLQPRNGRPVFYRLNIGPGAVL